MVEDAFMQGAIAPSTPALDTPRTEPFGAIEAIRDACRRRRCVDLSGCDLYSSCEPCAMCVATMTMTMTMTVTGIPALHDAAGPVRAGEAFADLPAGRGHPIDVDAVRAKAGAPIGTRRMPASLHRPADAVAVLRGWAARGSSDRGPL